MAQQYLTFNDSLGKGEFGLKTDEDDAEIEALRRPMNLKDRWVLWEQVVPNEGKQANYTDATREVTKFSTVQDFWAIWNGLPQPSELLESKRIMRDPGPSNGSPVAIDAIMIFREGIRPEWEDRANATGGHFQIQLKPSTGGGQIDEYWNNIVLGMIGGTIDPSEMITGVRLVDKLSGQKAQNSIRIELWFTRYRDENAVNMLKRSMEKCMATRVDGSVQSASTAAKVEVKMHANVSKH